MQKEEFLQKGLLFSDVKSDFSVFPGPPFRICYLSTSNAFRLVTLYQQRFVETLSLSLTGQKSGKTICNLSPLLHHGDVYIFYLEQNHAEQTAALCCLNTSSPADSIKQIKNGLHFHETLHVFTDGDRMIINLVHEKNSVFYYLSEDFTLIPSGFHNVPSENTSIDVHKFQQETETLRNSLTRLTCQYDELSEYAGKLQDELRKTRYGI